jgi:hypothetical protein
VKNGTIEKPFSSPWIEWKTEIERSFSRREPVRHPLSVGKNILLVCATTFRKSLSQELARKAK